MQPTCKQCGTPFDITPDDLAFYDKVSPVFAGKKELIPPPTLCPDCRAMRRFAWRNERCVYRTTCQLCRKSIISIYHPESGHRIYCHDCFHGNDWDQHASGVEIDWSLPFFDQFHTLAQQAPKLAIQTSSDLENSEYVNHCASSRNCYLIFASVHDEDCLYDHYVSHCRDTIDCLRVHHSELCYECVDCKDCYSLFFSQECEGCKSSAFLYNCRSCTDCYLCTNLTQKRFCILNEEYSEEEYMQKRKELAADSVSSLRSTLLQFAQLKQHAIRKSMEGYGNIDSSGNVLINCNRCSYCFDLADSEDCRYVVYGNGVSDSMDCYAAYATTKLCYECVGAGDPSYNALFCYLPWQGSDLLYCVNTFPAKNCFGCHHIRNAQYCIFNKQYSQEEYEMLVPKIIAHMRNTGEWGEFFPTTIAPFGYNETAGIEYYPLTREEALSRQYRWSDYVPPPFSASKTIPASQLPDSIDDIPDDILNWAIECDATKRPFKIIKQELEFYRQMRLPVPRLHPDERHRRRMALRNPRKLWKRECQKCGKDIETSYAPDRPEIVYCEECYLAEVY